MIPCVCKKLRCWCFNMFPTRSHLRSTPRSTISSGHVLDLYMTLVGIPVPRLVITSSFRSPRDHVTVYIGPLGDEGEMLPSAWHSQYCFVNREGPSSGICRRLSGEVSQLNIRPIGVKTTYFGAVEFWRTLQRQRIPVTSAETPL